MAGQAIVELFIRMLNDLTSEAIKEKFEDKEERCPFLQRVRGEWLQSFTDEDQIYQEFQAPTDDHSATIQEEAGLETPLVPQKQTWRASRPLFRETMVKSLMHGLVIILTGVLVGCISVGAMYATLKACPFPADTTATEISRDELWSCKGMDFVVIISIHFWIVTNLTFIYGWRELLTTWAYPIAAIGFLVDVTYRLILIFTGLDQLVDLTAILKIPLHVLWVVSMFAQCYSVTYLTPFHSVKKRLCLVVKFIIPPGLSMVIAYTCFYGIYPLFNKTQSTWGKFFIAVFAPVVGSVIKSVVRILVQRFYYVNHPGTSFIFIVYPYLVSALMFRILQVELKDLEFIALLGIVHGIVEVLERSTLVLRDHLDNQLYEGHLAPVGAFRTPRSERLTADIAVMSMIYETSSVVVTSGIIFCFHVLHQENLILVDLLYNVLAVMGVQIAIEWVFTSISLAIESHFQNMAVFRIWRKKKCLHISVVVVNFIFSGIFNPNYFDIVVNYGVNGTAH